MPGLTRAERLERDTRIRALKALEVRTNQLKLVSSGIHVNRDREKLEFADHYFMKKIYGDAAPEIAVMSSVQTGKTEYLISYGKACVDANLSVLHALPRYESRNTFVSGRIDPLIEDVPQYRATLRATKERKAADNKSIKLFQGGGIWRFVGSNVRADFKEFSADVLIADEWDEFDMTNAPLALDRLEASLFKFKRYCANPTVPDYGIHTLFKRGTQNTMHYRCTGCEKFRKLDFFECVAEMVGDDEASDFKLRGGVAETDEYACHACGSALDREDWRWIPLNTDGEFPSYHISKMMVRSASPKVLWRQFQTARVNDTELEVFYNSILGVPFEQTGNAITADMLTGCALLKRMPDSISTGWSTMGVDVGAFFDVRISKIVKGVRCCMHVGRYRDMRELHSLVKRYRVKVCVVDALPETRKVKEFQADMARVGCWVWLCRFKGNEGRDSKLTRDESEREFSVDRTYAMDMALADYRDKKNLVPINAMTMMDGFWLESMTSNKRILESDARGNRVYRWTKSDKDHARFADVYDMLAYHIFGAPAAEASSDSGVGVEVLQRGVRNKDAFRNREFMGLETEPDSGSLKRIF